MCILSEQQDTITPGLFNRAIHMPLRYTDLDTPISEYPNFIIRRRFPTFSELFLICVAAIIFSVSLSITLNDRLALIGVLITTGGGACLYVLRQVKKSRDLLFATEVQNALLSSAMGIDSLFYFIARSDGGVVQFNRASQGCFPNDPRDGKLTVRAWAERQGLRQDQATAIEQAVAKQTKTRMTITMRAGNTGTQACTLHIDPIPQPAGFLLLRCYAGDVPQ